MFGEKSELKHLEREVERIKHALRLIAFVVVRDENELNALLADLHAPSNALSGTTVTVTK
jgi:hypothetical protein